MATLTLTRDKLESTVADNKIVVIDFWASWCGPCRSFAPVFEAASNKHTDVVFAKVNTEVEKELAAIFQVSSIPMIVVFREEIPVFGQAGSLPAQGLEDLIVQVKALDMKEVRRDYEAQLEEAQKGIKA